MPTADLRPGDRILVRPGDVIAADGQVEDGESQVDESLLTGESAPADRGPGDLVSGGTINESGSLTVRVRRVGDESAHGKVLRLIRDAESHRAPILRAAEAYARWFTPGVLTLAGVVWVATGDVQRAVTMLIVGCPCAFVLATPTAIVAAMSRAAREGLLVKGGRYVEGCARVAAIAFDKTGTLTKGECRVVDVIPAEGGTQAGLLAAAARLEAAADHPLARAIQARAAAEGRGRLGEPVDPPRGRARHHRARRRRGRGVAARERALHGPPRHRRRASRAPRRAAAGPRALDRLRRPRGSHAKGLLSIEDEVRPEARDVIAELRADGLREVSILSGDARAVALAVAADVGVDPADVEAELLPEQKYERVQALERQHGRLCYVGDGANDGPALSVATVGVSLGSRHDTVALETAAVVLMRNSLSALPFLFRLSRTDDADDQSEPDSVRSDVQRGHAGAVVGRHPDADPRGARAQRRVGVGGDQLGPPAAVRARRQPRVALLLHARRGLREQRDAHVVAGVEVPARGVLDPQACRASGTRQAG